MTQTAELLEPPSDLSEEEYAAVEAAIFANVEAGFADPLLGLSDDAEVDLVRLAFNDTVRLERLERRIKERMRAAQMGEGAAAKFNLGTYRRGAKQLRDRIAKEVARRQKLAARNLRVIEGSRGDEKLAGVPEDAPVSDQADLYSNSPHLQAAAWLRLNRPGRIWYDEFHQNFWTDWDGTSEDRLILPRPVDDNFLLNVHTTLHRIDVRLAKSPLGNSERAVHVVGFEDRRHEARDWLTSLHWDGVERLETLMPRAYGTPSDDYHRAVGRCWFVSMAARIMQPGAKVHTMPVFVGNQGFLKSTALEIIGGKWYGVINVSADKQNDFVGAMAGLVVAEIAELDAISGRRVENSRVKTLLSTAEDRYRPPYGRTTQVFKRTAVLAGTTNDPNWHRDETGARRFWTVVCQKPIDVEWIAEHREQLFAEAHARWVEKCPWWDVPREEQERLAMEHFASDPWEERIEAALARGERIYTGLPGSKVGALEGDPSALEQDSHWGTLVTTARIMTQWLQLPTGRQGRRESLDVARIMRKLGWQSRTVRLSTSRTVKVWVATGEQEELRVAG